MTTPNIPLTPLEVLEGALITARANFMAFNQTVHQRGTKLPTDDQTFIELEQAVRSAETAFRQAKSAGGQ
jgi:hypothetical protein